MMQFSGPLAVAFAPTQRLIRRCSVHSQSAAYHRPRLLDLYVAIYKKELAYCMDLACSGSAYITPVTPTVDRRALDTSQPRRRHEGREWDCPPPAVATCHRAQV